MRVPAFYRALLRLLPSAFRDEYGEEMCAVVAERWRSVGARSGSWRRVRRWRFWARESAAVVRAALLVRGFRRGLGGAGRVGRPAGVRRGPDPLVQDVRHAVRVLAKRPAFSLLTVATLGLGIGASTTLFSVLHAVLIRPLPYGDADRVVVIEQTSRATGERLGGISAANVRDVRDAAQWLSAVAVAEPWSLDFQLERHTESLRAWAVSADFFEATGPRPLLGRTFLPEEFVAGGDRVVLLGHASWVARFAADPGLVGRTLRLDGEAYTVVGVLPPSFRFPDRAELWIPRAPAERDAATRAATFMVGVGRLGPGATLAQAQADADRVAVALARQDPAANGDRGLLLLPLRAHLFGDARVPLLTLFGAAAFLLLIACVNVAGLMLAQGAHRQREFALRSALGAGRGRLVRLVAVEGVVLALAGCVFGTAFALGGVRLIQALGPDHLPRIDELRIDGIVLAFAAGVAGLSALLSGLAPSLRLSRPDLRGALAEGSRGATAGRATLGLRSQLVVLEIAAAVMLLVGAGLLIRSFAVLLDRDLGFRTEDRVAVQVFAFGYADVAARAAFIEESVRNLEAVPGVRRVALTSSVPGASDAAIAAIDIARPYTIEGRVAPAAGAEPVAWLTWIAAGYPDVLGIPLIEGRTFDARDHATSPPVVMVNGAFARRAFPGGSAVGEKVLLRYGAPVAREIVGVLRDVRPLGHASDPRPEVYLPVLQSATGNITFVVETAPGIRPPTQQLLEAIWSANPAQSIWGAATLASMVADHLRERRFNLLLLTGFAVVAVLLAGIGVYGLVSFSVEQRTGELGIRRALGGRSADLVGMIVRQGAVLAAGGVAAGLVGASLLARLLRGMLFGVDPFDAATFAVMAAGMLLVATVASLVPALRALRVEPVAAFRAH